MKNAPTVSRREGSILILALWALSFLSVFVFLLGFHVRAKMQVLSRLEKINQLQWSAEAGVRIARAVYGASRLSPHTPILPRQKQDWLDNPQQFSHVRVGKAFFDVSYDTYADFPRPSGRGYGFTDEERRININTAHRFTLKRLVFYAAVPDEKKADDIAKAIIDWRVTGESDIVGFFSDDFYENLEFPYEPKKKDFEILDELLLVKGIDPGIFAKLKDLVTVYGSGQVNINTAPRPVLLALGLSPPLVDRIIAVRSGVDGVDGTADDYIFMYNSNKTALVLPNSLNLTGEELAEIDFLYIHGIIGISSSCFRVESRGFFEGLKESRQITCVFDGNSGKIFYWKEAKQS